MPDAFHLNLWASLKHTPESFGFATKLQGGEWKQLMTGRSPFMDGGALSAIYQDKIAEEIHVAIICKPPAEQLATLMSEVLPALSPLLTLPHDPVIGSVVQEDAWFETLWFDEDAGRIITLNPSNQAKKIIERWRHR